MVEATDEGSGDTVPGGASQATGSRGARPARSGALDQSAAGPAEVNQEGEAPQRVRVPYRPSTEEVEKHNASHCPPRSWCDHCVKGQFKDQRHRTNHGDDAESTVARVGMDYYSIGDDIEGGDAGQPDGQTSRVSMTCMAMQESECGSVWSYAVTQKGATERWMVEQLVDDIATVGLGQVRVIVKSDQEPAITDVQRELAKVRAEPGTALENSRVGDSNSNGRAERAVQDLKGLIRTLRSFTEEMAGGKILLTDPIVPWMVRHAGHLITMCRTRDDGRTAYQRMKGRRTTAKLVPFGEVVLFKIPKTNPDIGDFQDRW